MSCDVSSDSSVAFMDGNSSIQAADTSLLFTDAETSESAADYFDESLLYQESELDINDGTMSSDKLAH